MRLRTTLLAALALTAIGAPAAHGASTLGPEAVDARFGSCGVRQVRIPSTASAAQRVAIAADGSAVIAGTAGQVAGNRDRLLFQRLRPDGSVDRSFAGAGVNVVQIPPAQGRQPTDVALTGLAIATDGKIVVSGSVQDSTEMPNTAAVLARFNADGTPDGSFGSGGFVVERLQGSVAELADVAIASDGKILAAGVRDTALPDAPRSALKGPASPPCRSGSRAARPSSCAERARQRSGPTPGRPTAAR